MSTAKSLSSRLRKIGLPICILLIALIALFLPALLLPVSADEGDVGGSFSVPPPFVAETSLSEAIDADEVVVIEVNIDRIKDPITGLDKEIPGGIASYVATVAADPPGMVQILAVRGVPPFDSPSFDPATGIFSATSSLPQQPDNTTVAKIVARLSGDAYTSCHITVAFQEIIAASDPSENAPEETSNSLAFLRGDSNNDGVVNIFDAMYIAQYIADNRPLDEIRPLNAASVNYGGTTGDMLNIFDAIYIAQYIVGTMSADFE